ncbi:MAG: hypothetical protein VW868_06525 [Bacteroidota bacterium]
MKSLYFQVKIVASAILLSTILLSCSNPVDSDDHDDHHEEPVGFVLKLNGSTVIQQLANSSIEGSISLSNGEETDLIQLYFLSDDGDEFRPTEDEYSIQAVFDPTGIVAFEQHDEDGKYAFHLHAEQVGSTNLQIKLMHGSHSDFSTQMIAITVTE